MPIEYLTPVAEDRAVAVLALLADHGQHRAPSLPDLQTQPIFLFIRAIHALAIPSRASWMKPQITEPASLTAAIEDVPPGAAMHKTYGPPAGFMQPST